MKAIIVATLAGFFLLGAAALHAYLTPVMAVDAEGRVYWLQYGRLHSPGWGTCYVDAEGRSHLKENGIETVDH